MSWLMSLLVYESSRSGQSPSLDLFPWLILFPCYGLRSTVWLGFLWLNLLTIHYDCSCFQVMGWDLLYDWASCDWNYRHISMTDHVFRLWAEIYCVTGLHGNWNCWLISMTDLVFRLWAEIYCVTGRGDYMQWKRLSDEVVPINITCVEDTPKTVFLVTAYNKHVEKILDIKIIQPGIYLCN